jgi:hypothetical protein
MNKNHSILNAIASQPAFLEAEDKIRQAKNDLLDIVQDYYSGKSNVTIRTQNEVLELFCSKLKETLFLSEKIKDRT